MAVAPFRLEQGWTSNARLTGLFTFGPPPLPFCSVLRKASWVPRRASPRLPRGRTFSYGLIWHLSKTLYMLMLQLKLCQKVTHWLH